MLLFILKLYYCACKCMLPRVALVKISLIMSTVSCLMVVFPTTNSLFLLGYYIANWIPGAQVFPKNVPYLEKQSISIHVA